MKKISGIIIGIIALLWIALKVFGLYDSKTILYNQASFEIYIDTSNLNVNEYFKLSKDTFDIEKHKIICQLPVDIQGFKSKNAAVRTDLNNIDCNAKFEKGKYIEYESYELKGTKFTLMVVNKNVNMWMLDSPLGQKLIVGKKTLNYNYEKGKINRLLISENGLSEYCK